MVSRAIYNLDASKATGANRIPAIVCKMCSPELSPVRAELYNKFVAKSSLVVPFLKMERDLIQVSIVL